MPARKVDPNHYVDWCGQCHRLAPIVARGRCADCAAVALIAGFTECRYCHGTGYRNRAGNRRICGRCAGVGSL